jgi:hypothetical protein
MWAREGNKKSLSGYFLKYTDCLGNVKEIVVSNVTKTFDSLRG